jgi:hypothetical protein
MRPSYALVVHYDAFRIELDDELEREDDSNVESKESESDE